MENRQIDKKLTKQIRIDSWWHKFLKVKASQAGVSIKTLVEGHWANIYQDETSKEST